MRELIDDPFYKLIEKYNICNIDYFLIEEDTPHCGYRSHKDAVLFAMIKKIERNLNEQLKMELTYLGEANDEPIPWNLDIGKAQAHQIDSTALFRVPKMLRTGRDRKRRNDCGFSDPLKGEQVPYWYAFLGTPYTSDNGREDFRTVNTILFPKGLSKLEVYEWTTDWAYYFSDFCNGLWGTACWSIYDKRMDRYAVILANITG